MKQVMKNLQQQIEELNENLAKQLPTEILEAFGKSIQDFKSKNIEANSIKTGGKFPDFSLPNSNHETVALKDMLKNGKVIIAFFRGSWCPYCNLELKALQDNLKQMTDKKATLIGISPQMASYNTSLKAHHQLGFELLTDRDNLLAKQIGISIQLQDDIIPVYSNLGIKLSNYNENDYHELPVPAVFVINTDYSITYKFVDSNYMNRINIDELIEQL